MSSIDTVPTFLAKQTNLSVLTIPTFLMLLTMGSPNREVKTDDERKLRDHDGTLPSADCSCDQDARVPHLAISAFAPASLFWMASSVSVLRPRSRFSSSSTDGGATKTKMARSPDSRTYPRTERMISHQ